MILPVVAYGNPVLKKRGADIEKGEMDVKALAEDMYETMYNANGVGIAAPQVGKSLRMFVVDSSPMHEEEGNGVKKVFINPEILEKEGDEWAFEEGCLSIPGIHEDVLRQEKVVIRYFDENWEEHEESYDGMDARVILHEYDHIEGILFTDHLTAFKKRLLKGKLNNISKGKTSVDYKMAFPLKK